MACVCVFGVRAHLHVLVPPIIRPHARAEGHFKEVVFIKSRFFATRGSVTCHSCRLSGCMKEVGVAFSATTGDAVCLKKKASCVCRRKHMSGGLLRSLLLQDAVLRQERASPEQVSMLKYPVYRMK